MTKLKEEHLNLSTDMALHVTRKFMRDMAQPFVQNGNSLLDKAALDRLASIGAPRG